MKIYRMKIQNKRTGETKTYTSPKQGSAPTGYKCIGVLGYLEIFTEALKKQGIRLVIN